MLGATDKQDNCLGAHLNAESIQRCVLAHCRLALAFVRWRHSLAGCRLEGCSNGWLLYPCHLLSSSCCITASAAIVECAFTYLQASPCNYLACTISAQHFKPRDASFSYFIGSTSIIRCKSMPPLRRATALRPIVAPRELSPWRSIEHRHHGFIHQQRRLSANEVPTQNCDGSI